MNFSVCILARNEEQTLPRLLKKLQGLDVVVLDTGSTDGTVDVARSLGAQVVGVGSRFLHESQEGQYFDFSEARNYLATLAKNDMVFMPDADEIPTVLDIEKLDALITGGAEAIEYEYVFSHDGDNDGIKFWQTKFYDRRKAHWEGIVHEAVVGNVQRVRVPNTVLRLEHFQNGGTNRANYLTGLAVEYALKPEDPRRTHYYGRELYWFGHYEKSIEILKRHLTMCGWPSEKAQSAIFIGDAIEKLGGSPVEWYHKAFEIDSTRRKPLLKLAEYYYNKKDIQRTASYCAAALEIKDEMRYADDSKEYTYWPHEMMYWALYWLGDMDGAKEHFYKALAFNPTSPRYLAEWYLFYNYKDIGIEGWMTPLELNWLYETSLKMTTIAEIGSWKGRSTHALLMGGAHVTAIDTFGGSGVGDGTHNADAGMVRAEFDKNVGYFTGLEVKQMTSEEASKTKDMYDMVFIDAGHTYEEVKKDIEMWKPHAKKLLCGHDYCDEWPGVKKAVSELLGDVKVVGSIWMKYLN